MSLKDEMLALQPSHGPTCGVVTFLAALDPKNRAECIQLFDDRTIRHKTFSRWAEKREMRLSADTVSRHRRRECGCGHS